LIFLQKLDFVAVVAVFFKEFSEVKNGISNTCFSENKT
jgi:hypothetical protein